MKNKILIKLYLWFIVIQKKLMSKSGSLFENEIGILKLKKLKFFLCFHIMITLYYVVTQFSKHCNMTSIFMKYDDCFVERKKKIKYKIGVYSNSK